MSIEQICLINQQGYVLKRTHSGDFYVQKVGYNNLLLYNLASFT